MLKITYFFMLNMQLLIGVYTVIGINSLHDVIMVVFLKVITAIRNDLSKQAG